MEWSVSPAFKAIADPTRRAILQALAREEMAVQEIAAGFAMSRPAVSKHLRILKEAGLLSERRSGRQNFYRLEPAPLGEVADWLVTCSLVRRRPAPRRQPERARQAARPVSRQAPGGDWRVW